MTAVSDCPSYGAISLGNLGDRIGRRRRLLWGAAAFGRASILAAFSRCAELLIASRAWPHIVVVHTGNCRRREAQFY